MDSRFSVERLIDCLRIKSKLERYRGRWGRATGGRCLVDA